MLDYFDFEDVIELKPIDVRKKILEGTNYLCVFQPHGALSFTAIVAAVNSPPEFRGKFSYRYLHIGYPLLVLVV